MGLTIALRPATVSNRSTAACTHIQLCRYDDQSYRPHGHSEHMFSAIETRSEERASTHVCFDASRDAVDHRQSGRSQLLADACWGFCSSKGTGRAVRDARQGLLVTPCSLLDCSGQEGRAQRNWGSAGKCGRHPQ